MPKKIRVYELAKELGLTNKEGLELALSLGIGVKSHSSSIEDAQADRVRRKADAEGLRRPVQPEEPAPAKKAAKKAAPAAEKAPAAAKRAPVSSGTGTGPAAGGAIRRRCRTRFRSSRPSTECRADRSADRRRRSR